MLNAQPLPQPPSCLFIGNEGIWDCGSSPRRASSFTPKQLHSEVESATTSFWFWILFMQLSICLLCKFLLFSSFPKTKYSERSIFHHEIWVQEIFWVLNSWQLFWDNLSDHHYENFKMNEHSFFLRHLTLRHLSKMLVFQFALLMICHN